MAGTAYLISDVSYPPGTVVPGWLETLQDAIGKQPKVVATRPRWLRALLETCFVPLKVAVFIPMTYGIESGVRDGILNGLHGGLMHGVQAGLTGGIGNWLVAAVLIFIAVWSRLVLMTDNPAYFSLRVRGRRDACMRAVSAGALLGAVLGLALGFGVRILSSQLAHEHPFWPLGVLAGLVLGGAFGLAQWGRTPDESAPATNPAEILRSDRSLVLLLSVVLLVVLPMIYGIGFASGGDSRVFAHYGIYGLGIGLALWVATMLSHAWPQYLITTAWHASRGRLPWRLAWFLEEAKQLRILRSRGAVYQFRHARLQNRLAGRE